MDLSAHAAQCESRAGQAAEGKSVMPNQLGLLEPATPDGFVYRPGLISSGEQSEIVRHVRDLPFQEFEFQGYRGKRRVVSFGLHYDFARSKLQPASEMPAFLLPLRQAAARFARLAPEELPHVLITEYSVGAAIGWHKDRLVFEDVIGISLLSACRFRFRKKSDRGWARAAVILEPGSAYLLRGPARSEWEHSIPEAESLRYSITFRSLKRKDASQITA
jgi:alkylated DNA repair dioxygenase AlkB